MDSSNNKKKSFPDLTPHSTASQPPEEKRLKHREIDALEASYGPNDDDDDDEDEDEEELENNKTSTFHRKN